MMYATTSPAFAPGGSAPHERVLNLLPPAHRVRQRVEAIVADVRESERKLAANHTALNSVTDDRQAGKLDLAALERGEADAVSLAAQRGVIAAANKAIEATHADAAVLGRELAEARELANKLPAVLRIFYLPANTRTDRDGNLIRRDAVADISLAKLPVIKASSKEDATALVMQDRNDFGVLRVEDAEIKAAPVDFESAKRKLLADLDTLAESAELTISKAGPWKGRLSWPKTSVNAAPAVDAYIPRITHTDALLVRHLRPQIEAEALGALEQYYAGLPRALSANDRRIAERDVAKQIRLAEAEEIEAIWRARELGAQIRFRGDTNPYVLLGIVKP